MKYNYFPKYQDIKERLENLVIHAENLYFGDLDLGMEGLYFNIENELDLLLENLEKVGITENAQMDLELKTLIMRATIILINYE